MNRLWRRLPADNLGKTRLAAVFLACLSLFSQFVLVGNVGHGPVWHAASRTALAVVVVILIVVHRRERSFWWDPVVLPVLVVIGGSGLRNPVSTAGIAIATSVVLSLYGSGRAWRIRAAATFCSVPAAIALSPHANGFGVIRWNSGTVIGILPQVLLMTILMRGIFLALQRQQRIGARDAVLARAGGLLLAADELDEVHAITGDLVDELIALTPNTGLVVLAPQADGLTVVKAVGVPAEVVGTKVPAPATADPAAHLAETVPAFAHWRAQPISGGRTMLIGGSRPVPDDVMDSFRTLSHQVCLAEASRLSHAELDHQANHDTLTQLPTRGLFFRQVAHAADTAPGGRIALLNIDLDDFKEVNDAHGHGAGDELLIEVAARLSALTGPDDVAARFGGDEFAVLLTGLTEDGEAERIATRICAELVAPMRLTVGTVTVGASIGVAVGGDDLTAADLIRCADIAMYSAKARGKNRVEMFTAEQHGDIARHRMLEKHVGFAAERDEITVSFRPYVDPRTGICTQVEAVGHWQHPVHGTLAQAELLQLADRTGVLRPVGRHLLETTFREVAALPEGRAIRLTIGVAIRQLLDAPFADDLLHALAAAGLQPALLTVEVCESDQLDTAVAQRQLARLTEAGVRVGLDAASTRTISITSMHTHPIHQLAVDAARSLTGDALELILLVGQVLGTDTVVQGVRTEAQLARLRDTAVDAVQGDLVAPAMAAPALAGWMAAGPSAALRRMLAGV